MVMLLRRDPPISRFPDISPPPFRLFAHPLSRQLDLGLLTSVSAAQSHCVTSRSFEGRESIYLKIWYRQTTNTRPQTAPLLNNASKSGNNVPPYARMTFLMRYVTVVAQI
ncbi:hypothetical protein AVEN_145524-1 [Araneus ventricosus]|uniref:Uncharacterized protein n=1 Tax=Araneus ventricosus TaxID=182803 RepID=A0A4Y2IIX1_ARAVE|nr:hypothetical protein AVEN_145524-1 [Araneus ventricosus]